MQNKLLATLAGLPLILFLVSCGSDSDEPVAVTTNPAAQNLPPATAATTRPQGSNTRSPQGVNNDGDNRRNQAINRPGRGDFTENNVDTRPVRSYDGTSNNQANPTWGASFEHLKRIAPNDYADGVFTLAGPLRKSARVISNIVLDQSEGEDIPNTYNTTDFLWQWGQFVDHDIDLTDGGADESEDIVVPDGDVYFDPDNTGTVVIAFNRALYDPDTGTSTTNPREQENEITSWIDGSMVYGSSEERNTALRVGSDSPFLKTGDENLLPFNVDDLTNASGFVANTTSLFLAGDIRANEQVGLTVMHTLWMREHNRIAALLQEQNPNDSAESIYQSARRLVIAEIQKITYDEYLPALLGADSMPTYSGYDSSINPTIYNEFSAAAYRLGHSEVSDTVLRIDADGSTNSLGNLSLREAFFTGIDLLQAENDIDPILRGLANQAHQAIDAKVVNNLRNFLFGQPGSGGFDLVALNIQRGRDHGLPSYNAMRAAMGLAELSSFSEISSDTEVQTALSEAYESVDDIDLWVGGLAEDPLVEQDSQLGELFTAINVKQFD